MKDFEERAEKKEIGPKANAALYLHDFAYLLVIILVLLLVVFRIVIVSGDSMNTTLVDGDYLLLLNNNFYNEPKYGDVVVVCKQSFENGKPIVKRVIATEGQKVDIDFYNGIVYVDDVALQEDYINSPTNIYEGVKFPIVIEKNCVFVMGDNRNDSRDSRSPDIGQVDTREILGRVICLIMPGTDWGSSPRQFNRIGGVN